MSTLISICTLTYNHAPYIRKCLDGFVKQKTNFKFEVLIYDDASDDGTREILKEYELNYPDLIKPIYQHENQFSKSGGGLNIKYNFNRAASKYIAMCEGDDYWTDEYKLQKQVDFLEANNEYSICFHKVNELVNGNELSASPLNSSVKEETFTIEDLANGNLIHTPSVVFRNGLIKEFPVWFSKSPAGDYPLHMLNAKYGKIKYFPDIMAVYRKHGGSTWSSKPKIQMYENWLIVLDFLISEFEDQIKLILQKQKFKILIELADEYKIIGEEQSFVNALSEALLIDKLQTQSWISTRYLTLLNALKKKEAIPNGVKQSLRHLARQIRLKLYNSK